VRASPTAELLFGTAEIQDDSLHATDTHIYAYVINSSTGTLTAVAGSPFFTTNAPFDLTVSPNGAYVYAVEAVSGTGVDAAMEGFKIDATTGALSNIGAISGVPTAEGCRFDQSGLYLFCIDTILGTTLTVNVASPSTGALTHGADLSVNVNFPYAVTD
jgi:DNA-binding beta-propeller fold protein YncE